MFGIIMACILGPFSAAYVLGPVAGLLLLGIGFTLGVTLGWGVYPGTFTTPDYIVGKCEARSVALLAECNFLCDAMLFYAEWDSQE